MADISNFNAQSSTANDNAAQPAKPVQVIPATNAEAGQAQFKLPVAAREIVSVEVVDLDLVLVSQSGERFLLQQGALQATTHPESKIAFSDGASESAADQLKKVGVFKPITGGSFRLQASDSKPDPDSKNTGHDFGIGKEQQESQSKEASEKLEEVTQKLEQMVQMMQSESTEQSQNQYNGLGEGLGAGKGPGTGITSNNLASPTPGSTPQKKQDFTSNFTSDFTSNNTADSENLASYQRGLYGNEVSKVSNVVEWNGIAPTNTPFSDTSIRLMLADSPLKVVATGDGPVVVNSAWTDKVLSDFLMPGTANATSLKLTLLSQSGDLPPGFLINGQQLTAAGITLDAKGSSILRLPLSWTIAADGSQVTSSTFKVGVQFYDASGHPLSGQSAPINFYYGDVKSSAETLETDVNGNFIIKLPAFGVSYDITGKDGVDDAISGGNGADIIHGLSGNDSINGGGGDDTLIGGDGADTLDGGTGNNTVSYAGSAAVEVHLDGMTSSGGDVLSNIQNLIGSDNNDTLIGNAQDNKLSGGLGDDNLQGGAGADTLNGGAGNDILNGGQGADVLIGGDGQDTASYEGATAGVTASLVSGGLAGEAAGDTYSGIENLIGSSYADQLIGDYANNQLSGGDGNDSLDGGSGNDSLEGGAGNDLLTGGQGADVLKGGDGIDTASYANANAAVEVSLALNAGSGDQAQGDTYDSIENVIGSIYDDRLAGNDGSNQLDGGIGNDLLKATIGGSDTLEGGIGTDTVDYSAFTDTVTISLVKGTAVSNTQTDSLKNIENVIGGIGNDSIAGDANNNLLQAMDGNDTLSGAAGDDTLEGGNGNDVLIGGSGADSLVGGDGTDTASYQSSDYAVIASLDDPTVNQGDARGDSYVSIENLTGSAYSDQLTGDNQNNSLSGLAGNDTLIATLGKDTLDGGDGIDSVDYSSLTDGVTISLDANGDAAVQVAGAVKDQLISIENLTGGQGNDQLTGNAKANLLSGGLGNDVLSFSSGANDTLDGGDGSDTANYAEVSSNLTIALNNIQVDDTVKVHIGTQTDSLRNIENLTSGSGNDSLTGDTNINYLTAGSGNDTLIGILGATGAGDTLDGGDGTDTADYSNLTSAQAVTVSLTNDNTAGNGNFSVDIVNGTGTSTDSLKNIENISSGAGNDVLKGDAQANYLKAGAGNDILYGSGGGNDTLDGGTGTDTVTYENISQNLSIDLSQTKATIGSQIDTLNSIENATGGSGNDSLKGDTQANYLKAGAGNDILYGSGGGNDTLDGGTGTDTVTYENISQNLSIDLSQTKVTIGSQTDTLISIENATGGSGNDSLKGDANVNSLTGGAGNDTLVGTLGGAGDSLDGGTGTNTADYSGFAAANAITVDLSTKVSGVSSLTIGGTSQTDALKSIANITGGAGNDSIKGDSAANSLIGGDGADTLFGSVSGGAGNDTIDGGAGIDTVSYDKFKSTDAAITQNLTINLTTGKTTVTGSTQVDTLTSIENVIGGDGNDTITGSTANNDLKGGAGDDTFKYSAGVDTIDGGANTTVGDTVDYTGYTAGALTLVLSDGVATDNLGNKLSNIENIVGVSSLFVNTITGNSSANQITGGAGNDVFFASAGNDTLDGAGGTDKMDYSSYVGVNVGANAVSLILNGANSAIATISATTKTDTLKNIEIIISGGGNDTITGDTANNSIDGGDGNDSLSGGTGIGTGNDTLIGGAGNDTLDGGDGSDSLDGGVGDDILIGGAGSDTLVGGSGNDTASYSTSTAAVTASLASGGTGGDASVDTYNGIENLLGGSGNDTLTGDVGVNILSGGAGNDTFKATAGGTGDTYYGGTSAGDAGTDTVDYSVLSTNISIQLADTGNTIVTVSGTQTDTLSGIENITSGGGNDTLTGNKSANSLSGGTGNDSLDGGQGADSLSGGDGNDTLIGGAGNDTLDGADTLNGGIGDDNLSGGYGNDSLDGGAGNDSLVGGDGNDSLDGGAGADSLVGGDGTDTVTYANAVTVDLTNTILGSATGAGDAAGDVISTDIEIIIGSGAADTFIGRITAETIQGGAGDDTIKGSLGADSIDGGTGTTDVMDYSLSSAITINLGGNNTGGFADGDVLTSIEKIIGGAGNDTMTASSTAMFFDGNGGNDSLTGGTGNDTLNGSAGNDTLIGSGGNDSLDGGDGDDTLTTGSGNDTLKGGAGNDSLNGGDGNNSLESGDGNDTLTGGTGDDVLDFYGSVDKDTLSTGPGSSPATNSSLFGDSGLGGKGNDTFIIEQSKLVTGSFPTLDGGAGTDTLKFLGVTSATVDLTSLSGFSSFETLDVSLDSTTNSNIILSSAGIQGLVDNGNASVLNIKLSATDLVSISTVSGETWSFNNTSNTYSFIQGGNIVAQANLISPL